MKSDLLRGIRIKLDRADHLIAEIEQEIAPVFKGNAFAYVEERDPQSGDRLAKIKIIRPLPDRLFALVPEVIYHLRSSLDQLMVTIARNSGVSEVSHILFPFGEDAAAIERACTVQNGKKGKMVGIPAEVQEMVKDLKPYRGGNNELWALSRLSNLDKHRDLIPVGSVGGVSLLQNCVITKLRPDLSVARLQIWKKGY